MKEKVEKDMTYLHERLKPLGWSVEANTFDAFVAQVADGSEPIKYTRHLFDADADGNIIINYYNVDGHPAEYRTGKEKWAKNYSIKRLRVPRVDNKGNVHKYHIPRGAGTFPWIPPRLIDAYREKRTIENLYMTEGAIKAFAAAQAGLDIIGLTSITHYKDKSLQSLHVDVLRLIRQCKPKNVIWLVDGDCRDLTSKWPEDPEVDLRRRPHIFYRSAVSIAEFLKDEARKTGFDVYFMHVVSESVESSPKGLDDLILAYADTQANEVESKAHLNVTDWDDLSKKEQKRTIAELQEKAREIAVQQVIEDVQTFSSRQRFFQRFKLDRPGPLRKYFAVTGAQEFYALHASRIGKKVFVYDGTKYEYTSETETGEAELRVKVPKNASVYVRVGDTYYERVKVPKARGVLEMELHKRDKTTITDDHDKSIIKHIRKFKAFCNVPSHLDYQEVIHQCYNRYAPFEHEMNPGEWPVTEMFLKHIFGTNPIDIPHPRKKGERIKVNEYELGLDYLQLLFIQPTQTLPILCLVSKQRGTGKTTFSNWLKRIFTDNMRFLSNKDLENDFNADWSTKLLICLEEAFVEKKQVVEMLKNLSTAEQISVNAKGKDQREIDVFMKIILNSNNERNFIQADKDEVRFWVRKINPVPPENLNVDVLQEMESEISAFLYFLNQRSMATENLHRAWFTPKLIETDALQIVRSQSKPFVAKEITEFLKTVFLACREEQLYMHESDFKLELFKSKSTEVSYIREVIKEHLPAERFMKDGKEITKRYHYYRLFEDHDSASDAKVIKAQRVKRNPSRPWVFNRKDFIPDDEWTYEPDEQDAALALVDPNKPSAIVEPTEQDDLPF